MLSILSHIFLFARLDESHSFQKPLSAEEEKTYIEAYGNGSVEAKNILIERNMRLVAFVARKYQNKLKKDNEDLISIGSIGLIKGIHTFKPNKGTKLSTYIARCIENEILMHLRSSKKYGTEVYMQEMAGKDREGSEIRIEERLSDDAEPVFEQVHRNMQIEKLHSVLPDTLDCREKKVVTHRYGLDGAYEMTQSEIAAKENISRSYVSRIEKRALKKLRESLEGAY
jgi:RNA polymerase sporulation-specific sigma factor